jgi:integrase
MERRNNGEGSIYHRGRIYWIAFTDRNGEQVFESTKSTEEKAARALLRKRLGEVEADTFTEGTDKVKISQLCDLVIDDYRNNDRGSIPKAERSSRRIKGYFGHLRAHDISAVSKLVEKFKKERRKEASNASINRELAFLKRGYNLGIEMQMINRKPVIKMLEEDNVRQGFFEYPEYDALRNAAPVWFKPVVTFSYFVPWRKANVLGLQWKYVDLAHRVIDIPATDTKNKKAIKVKLAGELLEMLQGLYEKRNTLCPFVFTRDGKQINPDIRDVWWNGCVTAGLGIWKEVDDKKVYEGKLFHDFRRTGCRDIVRSGVSEHVAMMISGHKTRSVFDRYNIITDKDLEEAAERRNRYAKEQAAQAKKVVPLRG